MSYYDSDSNTKNQVYLNNRMFWKGLNWFILIIMVGFISGTAIFIEIYFADDPDGDLDA